MAFNKIRGQQIKNGSITGAHIQNNVITSDHLAQSAIQAVLQSKLVVDYVQLANPLTVNESTQSIEVAISGDPVNAGDLTSLGVLLDKKVIIRDKKTGEPIYNPDHKHEVYGKLAHDGSKYTLTFGCYEEGGEFTPFTFTAETQLEIQYAQRFTLASVNEMFAANEKFVDGAVDITASIKIKELQEKVEKLSNDTSEGTEELRRTLQAQIDAITEVIGKDATAESYVVTEDETPQPGKTYYTLNVANYEEAVVTDAFTPDTTYYEKVPAVEATGIKAILAQHTAGIAENKAKIAENAQEIESLKAKDLEIEGNITALQQKDTEIEGNITALQEKDTELQGAIDDLKAKDEELAAKLSAHKKYVVQIDELASKTQVDLPQGSYFKKLTGQSGLYEDALYVYVNGLLQAEDINFTQVEDDTHVGYCKGIAFSDDQLVEGDVVIIKWINATVE